MYMVKMEIGEVIQIYINCVVIEIYWLKRLVKQIWYVMFQFGPLKLPFCSQLINFIQKNILRN